MRHFYFFVLLFSSQLVAAQSGPAATAPADSVRYWATHLRAGLNANEALLSKNWKSGGTNSLGVSLLFNGTVNYQRGRVVFTRRKPGLRIRFYCSLMRTWSVESVAVPTTPKKPDCAES